MWTVYEMANRRGPGAVYKYWAWYGGSGFGWPPRRTGGERVAGSLLAPGLPQAVRAVLLFGPSSLAVIYSLFSLVQQWIHFTSVYSGLWEVQFLDKGVLAFRCATTDARLSGHSCCGAEAVPHSPALHLHGAVFGQGCCCARVGQ